MSKPIIAIEQQQEFGEVLILPMEFMVGYEICPETFGNLLNSQRKRDITDLKEQGYSTIDYPTAETIIRPDGKKVTRFNFVVFAQRSQTQCQKDK